MVVNNNEVEDVVDPDIIGENDIDNNIDEGLDNDLDLNPELDIDNAIAGIDGEDISKQQSKDKNHDANAVFAEMRRENERLQKLLKEKEDDTSELDKVIAGLYEEEGITEAKDLVKRVKTAEEEQKYAEAGTSKELVEKLVKEQLENSPEYKALKEKEQSEKNKAEMSEFDKSFPQYAEVELKDLPNLDTILEVREKKNLTFTEAFAIVNMKEIYNQKIIDIKNETKKKYASNSINRSSQGATGANVDVITDEDIASWHKVYSNCTDEQIVAKIKKYRGMN